MARKERMDNVNLGNFKFGVQFSRKMQIAASEGTVPMNLSETMAWFVGINNEKILSALENLPKEKTTRFTLEKSFKTQGRNKSVINGSYVVKGFVNVLENNLISFFVTSMEYKHDVKKTETVKIA